jgi:hypothetical protein
VRGRAAAIAALFLVFAPAAWASDATGAEVRELAARAADDRSALEELRRIDRVDGRPVDLGAALAGAQGEELERRLETLALEGASVETSPARDRAQAAEILDGPPYEQAGPPRPFRRFLDWLGGRLEPVGRPIEWLADRVPGGAVTLLAVLGGLVVLAAAFVAARLGAQRRGIVVERIRRGGRREEVDPGRLEQLADEAEARGELETALRLRFRAGLVRLAALHTVPQPENLTSRQLAQALGSPRFGGLARDLDEVVYGGRRASAADVASAREGWPQVLRDVRRP